MAEVIKFPGSWHGEPQEQKSSSDESVGEKRALSHEEKYEQLACVLNGVAGLVRTMNGQQRAAYERNKRVIAEEVEAYGEEFLMHFLLYSKEADWSARPAFFSALIDEARNRELM